MNEAGLHNVLIEWNATEAAYPTSALVHRLFEDQVVRRPAAIAAIFGAERLTYLELDARANRLANHLREKGASEGDRVGIYLERSLDLPVAMLAILKAGCVYVPLDPIYPDARVQFILDEAEVRLLITQSNLAAGIPSYSGRRIFLDTAPPHLAVVEGTAKPSEASSQPPPINRVSSDIAYLIYTSGSTGLPKGVEVTHRGFVNLLVSMAREPGMNPGDVMLALTTIAFDIAGLELILPLIVGGAVAIASREMTLDAGLLIAEIARVRATVMQATPATWRLLVEAGLGQCAPLRMLCGGERLPPRLAERLLDCGGDLWNLYGPTETTIWSSVSRVASGVVTIGRPIANTRFYVLDESGCAVPVGTPGELHIGGDGVARGYFKRAELTASKFIADPFSTVPGARMYRTGDLVRYLPSGELDFIGRRDRQVKLRGYRIELPEVEARLIAIPSIDDAIVVLAENPAGEPWLVAYVVQSRGRALESCTIRVALRKTLPDYMIPSVFVTIDALPRTLNGKVDLQALPTLKGAGRTRLPLPNEQAMRLIWEEVLGIKGLGLTDDIFALGADSLRILQIVVRARKAGISLNAEQIFEHRTVSAVAKSIP
jgi:amino acid adenylation domain-containing protein